MALVWNEKAESVYENFPSLSWLNYCWYCKIIF